MADRSGGSDRGFAGRSPRGSIGAASPTALKSLNWARKVPKNLFRGHTKGPNQITRGL